MVGTLSDMLDGLSNEDLVELEKEVSKMYGNVMKEFYKF